MSSRQHTQGSKAPSNLSKKRKYTDYKDGLAHSYQTDKEAKNTAKQRKANGQDLTRRSANNRKQAGREANKSANYRDLNEGKLKGGYLTESPSRMQARSTTQTRRPQNKKKVYEDEDEDEIEENLSQTESELYEVVRRTPNKQKRGAKEGRRSGAKSRKSSSSVEGGYQTQKASAPTAHNYRTRAQTNNSPIMLQNEPLADMLNTYVDKLADKYLDEQTFKKNGTYFDFGETIEESFLPDGHTIRYKFEQLELCGLGSKLCKFTVEHGIDFNKSNNAFSEFKEVFVDKICAEVKDQEVKRVYIQYMPILTIDQAEKIPMLKKEIQNLRNTRKDAIINSKSKFIVKNYQEKELIIDAKALFSGKWFNHYIYTLKFQESKNTKNTTKNLQTATLKFDYVQYMLDNKDPDGVEEILFLNDTRKYPYCHHKKVSEIPQNKLSLLSDDECLVSNLKSARQSSKKPSAFTKSPFKKGYQTEAESKYLLVEKRSKSQFLPKESSQATMKKTADIASKLAPVSRYRNRRARKSSSLSSSLDQDDKDLCYNSDFKYKLLAKNVKKPVDEQKNLLSNPTLNCEKNDLLSKDNQKPSKIDNDCEMKDETITEHRQESNQSVFDFDKHVKPAQKQQMNARQSSRLRSSRSNSEQSVRSLSKEPIKKMVIEIDKKQITRQKISSEEEIIMRPSRGKKRIDSSDEEVEKKVIVRPSRNSRKKIESSEEEVEQLSNYSDDDRKKPKRKDPPVRRNTRKAPPQKVIEEANSSSEASDKEDFGWQAQTGQMQFTKKVEPKYDNEYDRVCEQLQLNAIPDVLPCRDKERTQITEYLINGIQNKGSSSSLYISGMPGTGKTATTLEVLRNLKKKYRFDFIHINAMSLTNPNLVYSILHDNITGKRSNPATSAQFLDEFFKKKDKYKVLLDKLPKNRQKTKDSQNELRKIAETLRVVLIDELDALVTKKQTLLYNLFDWPCHQNSRLLVIAIANTMDLPEKLQSKIASRIGNNRLVYEPYNRDQIAEIIKSRLNNINIFDDQAVKIVAMKVSSYSGDIRRSLQVAKRALEIARDDYNAKYQNDKSKKIIPVSYNNVLDAFADLYNTKNCQVLGSLRKFEVLVIMAIYLEQLVTKAEKLPIDRIQDRCDTMLSTLNWNQRTIPTNSFKEIIKRLQSFGIINLIVENNKICDNVFVQLFVYQDEITNCFEKHEIYLKNELTIKIHSGQQE